MIETQPDVLGVTQLEIDQRVYDLYDEYCHGRIDRREFLQRAAALSAAGLAMAHALMPRYALVVRDLVRKPIGGVRAARRIEAVTRAGANARPAVAAVVEILEDIAGQVGTAG